MSLNSVQSFVIENCNGPTIENGLNNVCLHPLSRTFTFYANWPYHQIFVESLRVRSISEQGNYFLNHKTPKQLPTALSMLHLALTNWFKFM